MTTSAMAQALTAMLLGTLTLIPTLLPPGTFVAAFDSCIRATNDLVVVTGTSTHFENILANDDVCETGTLDPATFELTRLPTMGTLEATVTATGVALDLYKDTNTSLNSDFACYTICLKQKLDCDNGTIFLLYADYAPRASRLADHSDAVPLAGATLSGDVYVDIATDIFDAYGGPEQNPIERVAFRLDGGYKKNSGTPPYDLGLWRGSGLRNSFDTTTLADGAHELLIDIKFAETYNSSRYCFVTPFSVTNAAPPEYVVAAASAPDHGVGDPVFSSNQPVDEGLFGGPSWYVFLAEKSDFTEGYYSGGSELVPVAGCGSVASVAWFLDDVETSVDETCEYFDYSVADDGTPAPVVLAVDAGTEHTIKAVVTLTTEATYTAEATFTYLGPY